MSQYLNYNLFNQIAQQSNYDKKVAAADKAMQYTQELEQRAQRRLQEQMAAQESVASYMDAIDQKIGTLLPEDEERVRALEKQARQEVIRGVASAQGDYKSFMLQGGSQTLREYKKSVLDSDEVVNGLKNMDTYKAIQKDLSEGKRLHDVNVSYKGVDGKEYTEMMDIDSMMQLFQENKISNLNYSGGEKPVNVKPMDFIKNFHPSSPYESRPVTVEEYKDFAVMMGQSPDIAEKMAQEQWSGEVDKQGNQITKAWWGIKDDDWTGTQRRWGANGRAKAGAAKFLPALEMMQSMEPTGKREQTDWTTRDGKIKQRKTIEGYNPGGDALDAIKSHLGLVLNRDGSYSGQINNSIGFFNMENGRSHDIKGSDYELVGTGSEVQIVRDAETGETEMYMPVTIRVSEDYMEEHMGEGAWWNGWTMQSKEFGGVTVDKNVNGEDMREIQVSVNIPMDELSRENINRKIGWKEGQVIGGMGVEDYYSARVSAPKGAAKPPTAETYQRMNGQVFSSSQSKFEQSDADAYGKNYQYALNLLQNNPQFSNYSKQEISNLADTWAKQNM